MTDCPFCAKIRNGGDEHGKVFETYSSLVYWFNPVSPVTKGHKLFVPTFHIERADDAPLVLSAAVEQAARYAKNREIKSYNLIQSNGEDATQTVPHVHVHLVPRHEGDGLMLPWISH